MVTNLNRFNLKISSVNQKLVDWMLEEIRERKISHRELARRAGISHTAISNVLSGYREPTWDFLAAISKPLDKQPMEVFRIAGLLPQSSGNVNELSEDEAELVRLYRELPPGDVRSYALSFLRGFVDQMTD